MSGVVKRERNTFPIPLELRQYMTGNVEEITWSFINPTDALVRMLVLSPLAGWLHRFKNDEWWLLIAGLMSYTLNVYNCACVADPANLRLVATDSELLTDFSDGARYHRMQQALPEGTCALTSVLFFDEIQRKRSPITTHFSSFLITCKPFRIYH